MTTDGADRWWVTDPDDAARAAAAERGLVATRRLFQMRRPLPLGSTDPIVSDPVVPTRAFDPDRDVDDWLAINNAAFSWHPEQGGWTRATLEARMQEPWFDLEGFRIGTDASTGAMTGFCWTKVHADHDPVLGEIYVIAVAPAHAGRGLGRALTIAGLDWLWRERRTPVGMLYVEADNDRALATYRHLGFEVHATDVLFTPPPGSPSAESP
ncbi:MAG: mycothiol synthase [Acidimicrobiales bacterium]